ncbi:PadR family transcriptional regulator [Candidatus Bipolaricaulota bacterium]|nr:PadR family transcriptional regulator [Candidatus Bipolaricaulota bacterium]
MKGVRRGFLKYYILKLLKEGSYSGYGLIKEIEEETGFWEPSTGSVYPLLESLEEDELIRREETDRGSSWQITDKGKKAYEEASEAKSKMRKSLKQSMVVFSQIFNEEQIKEVAERMGGGCEDASGLRKKIHGLHHRLQGKVDNPDFSNADLRNVIERTHEELDKLTEAEE